MNLRLQLVLPYVIGLVAAGVLFYLIGQTEYTPRGNELAPTFWPRLAIGLMALACINQILRAVLGANMVRAEGPGGNSDEQSTVRGNILLIGIAALMIYGVLIPYLGFLLASAIFMGAFIYIGGYRRHVVIWSASAFTIVLVGFLFLRVAYISLPRGVPPFDRFTDFVRTIVGG